MTNTGMRRNTKLRGSNSTARFAQTVARLEALLGRGVTGDHVPRAQLTLGWMYEKGLGTVDREFERLEGLEKTEVEAREKVRRARALEYYEAAAASGLPQALSRVPSHILPQSRAPHGQSHGTGIRTPQAQFALAEVLEQGRCGLFTAETYWADQAGKKDPTGAMELYAKAAARGYARAHYVLGLLYELGVDPCAANRHRGVLVDVATAARHMRDAAELGYGLAQCNLGILYEEGRGVLKDERAAAYWYGRAAEQGIPEAQYYYGGMHASGTGGLPVDGTKAVLWLTRAAENRVAPAACALGDLHADGRGVPQNKKLARKWYRKASNRGSATAQYNLGVLHRVNKNCEQDQVEAVKYFRRRSAS